MNLVDAITHAIKGATLVHEGNKDLRVRWNKSYLAWYDEDGNYLDPVAASDVVMKGWSLYTQPLVTAWQPIGTVPVGRRTIRAYYDKTGVCGVHAYVDSRCPDMDDFAWIDLPDAPKKGSAE